MLTVSLLRHAKSSWDVPDQEDIERPLAPRGRKAAPLMGAFMAAAGIAPDLVLCSPSQRTRETLDLVRAHLAGKPKVVFDDALYLAEPDALLARLKAIKGPTRGRPQHVLIIGHNPGLQNFAVALMARETAHAADRRALSHKLPTAGLVVLDLDVKRWRDVEPGSGRLRHFMTPKRLPAA